MARWKPGSRGSATLTAKRLDAASVDTHNAQNGFWHASLAMQRGDYAEAKALSDGAVGLMKMVLMSVGGIR